MDLQYLTVISLKRFSVQVAAFFKNDQESGHPLTSTVQRLYFPSLLAFTRIKRRRIDVYTT